MQPTYTPPIPVIGNHPAGCSCTTCVGARKRLLASPFVQGLISDLSVLTNALNESRKISQEREKQLAEEKRLHGLSKMSDANARGTLQQIRTELGGDPDEPALTKVQKLLRECIERGVACEHNAAEVVRLAEALRLAEQGRQEALKSRDLFRGDLTAANNRERALERDRDILLSDKAELTKQLGLADGQVMAQVEQVRRATFEGTLQTIVASVLVAVAAFLVGRWAR
jgi:predicted phage tail protein